MLQAQLSQTGGCDITMNKLSDLAGKVYYKVPSCSETGDFLDLAPLPSAPTPLRLFLLLIPALTFSFLHMYSVFVIRHTDKYCCAQALCYDIFIVCVHVEDVDPNTAFYHTLNAALAN